MDGGQQFAANVGLPTLAVRHNALAGRNHGDTQAIEHPGQLANGLIDSEARTRLAFDGVNDGLAFGSVFQIDPYDSLRFVRDEFEVLDKSFFFEDPSDAGADFGSGDINPGFKNASGVSDPG